MKKIFQKLSRIFVFTAIATLPLLSLGCSSGPANAGPVVLNIWKPFVDSDKMQSIISAYQTKHPNVTINYTKKNIDNYEPDLLNALAAGNGPDIYSVGNTWVPRYMDKIVPAPDKTFIVKDYKDTFVDPMVSDLIRDNKIYGTAMWVDSLGLYYNKDLMGTAGIATPPKTWDELAADTRKIVRQDSTGYFSRSGPAMGTNKNVNRGQDIIYLLMLQAGVVPWTSDGSSPSFANEIIKNGNNLNPGQQAVSFYTSFSNPSSANYSWNQDSDYSIDAFANGRAAFLYGYSYTRAQINSKAPNLNYDVAPVPQNNLNDPTVNYSNYFAEVVSKQSKNQAVAWDFLKFATSKDALAGYYKTDKEPSSRRDLIEIQSSDPDIGVFAHANLTGKTFYKVDETKFDALIGDMIDNVVLRGQSIDQALSRAQSQASTLSLTRTQ
ncbi:MAG TPA: extracellular solute-binding protein [Patescibacteria group bacterium]|nr:extracellular solute-binding protein [Patescibacteria group bacterium]